MLDNAMTFGLVMIAFGIGIAISPMTARDSDLEVKAKAAIQVCEEHLPRDQHCELKAEPARGKEQ